MQAIANTLSLIILLGCKYPTAPLDSPSYSPQPQARPGPSYAPDYAAQSRIDNNQAPIGGTVVAPVNPTFANPEGSNKPFAFEEINPSIRVNPTLNISMIKTKQIFQRNAQNQAQVAFGTTPPTRPARFLRARAILDNTRAPQTQYLTVDLQTAPNTPLVLPLIGGAWYRVEVSFHDVAGRIVDVGYSNPFGVGDIFVIAGQSNSTNCGDTPLNTSTEFAVSTDGDEWQTANDPQIGTNDFSICQRGSSWPTAGEELVRDLQVPVAFASTGYSGTSVAEWLPNSGRGLYEFTLQRMRQLGPRGFRAVLWHQGENDVKDETPQQTYADRLMQIIRQSQQDMGWQMPWIVAQAAWCRQITEYNKPNIEPQIIAAQASLPRTYPFVFAGPNTDLLTEQYRGTNCHFNQSGQVESGKAWAKSISQFVRANPPK